MAGLIKYVEDNYLLEPCNSKGAMSAEEVKQLQVNVKEIKNSLNKLLEKQGIAPPTASEAQAQEASSQPPIIRANSGTNKNKGSNTKNNKLPPSTNEGSNSKNVKNTTSALPLINNKIMNAKQEELETKEEDNKQEEKNPAIVGGGKKKSRSSIEMAKRSSTRKSKSSRKGTRKLSPALKEWNRKVMEQFRAGRKRNPNYKLRDAMKDAKKAN